MTADDFRFAVRIAKGAQESGQLGDQVVGAVKVVFDAHHLTYAGPIYAALAIPRLPGGGRKAQHTWSQDQLRANLESRKREERLPHRRAFWELTRIVMTEKPKTFMDDLRFAAIRLMIVTGFRAGEAALLPIDWRRQRTYLDSKGRLAGESGGISTSVMIRHFAEKQQIEESDSRVLFEKTQPVPEMFVPMLEETLDHIAMLTEPLRKTLKVQCQERRLLPWYDVDEIVPVSEIYSRLTGHPFWTSMPREPYLSRYRENFDPAVLIELNRQQNDWYQQDRTRLDMAMYQFFNRLQQKMKSEHVWLRFRRGDRTSIPATERMSWSSTYLHIAELEAYIRSETPTKVSDMQPMPLASGAVQPWELLFIHPKRSLAEERNDGICDVTRYISVSRPDPTLIFHALGESRNVPSLFEKYGKTDEDRALGLESHMLRHLQNTELFRLGVADTIISKRFNRRSVAQSYDYDHRSLAEDLDQIEIPEDVEIMLGSKASTVARLIKGGKANGPIVDAFRRIQTTEGDTAAYEYLRVEADGFHATPYGHCLNSFTVDPCPKHLECFSGCRHLSATDLPENRANLHRLKNKFQIAIETIKGRPSSSVGWKNQLDHAEVRLAGIQKLLSTPNGEAPFPNGPDLSLANKQGVLDD